MSARQSVGMDRQDGSCQHAGDSHLICSGVVFHVSLSTSTNTSRARPHDLKDRRCDGEGGTITSSPGPIPVVDQSTSRAADPDDTATAQRRFVAEATCFSKASIGGDSPERKPCSRTLTTLRISASVTTGSLTRIMNEVQGLGQLLLAVESDLVLGGEEWTCFNSSRRHHRSHRASVRRTAEARRLS